MVCICALWVCLFSLLDCEVVEADFVQLSQQLEIKFVQFAINPIHMCL